MSTALILVDVQPTFCEGGELPVEGGNAVAAGVAAFLRAHRGDYDVLVTTQDHHVDPGDHFSDSPDFVDSWPAHGVAGTANAEIHPETAEALAAAGGADLTVLKGAHAAAYSGFDGTDQTGTPLAQALRERGVDTVDVCGIAESHCVKETVLDALREGLRTRLLVDLTVPVTAELGAAARAEMRAAGAEEIRTGLGLPR
ncbi:isochorismatase family protein [Nocardioides sp. zg-DK7169]|uniref:isochorismatase family protein n=1 Tax=Nocardioides sp. zg-DK7169 TaxID=2736600 RepID=UPI0015536863|nr:isochorismatase family protein [Nocardioides sp. zg-DK7169]NPC97822.1 isochorismatase family protein [Nocardioides sp. zg-DK7169]